MRPACGCDEWCEKCIAERTDPPAVLGVGNPVASALAEVLALFPPQHILDELEPNDPTFSRHAPLDKLPRTKQVRAWRAVLDQAEKSRHSQFNPPASCPVSTTCKRERECSGMCPVRDRPEKGNDCLKPRDCGCAKCVARFVRRKPDARI